MVVNFVRQVPVKSLLVTKILVANRNSGTVLCEWVTATAVNAIDSSPLQTHVTMFVEFDAAGVLSGRR